MIFIPLIASPVIIAVFNELLLGIFLFVICYGLLVVIAIYKRKNITRKFYKIKNAHNRFKIIEVLDENIIRELYDDSALTFVAEPSDKLLDFIFNWLNNEGVLETEELYLYTFNGELLNNVFDSNYIPNNMKFMSIFNKDLNINNENVKSYSIAHFQVKARWLDDIVNNSKDRFGPFKTLSKKASYDKVSDFYKKYNQNVNVTYDKKEKIEIKSEDSSISPEVYVTGDDYKEYLKGFEDELKEDEKDLVDLDLTFRLDFLTKLKTFDSYCIIKTSNELQLKYLVLLVLYIYEEYGDVLVGNSFDGLYRDGKQIKEIAIYDNIIVDRDGEE